MAEAALELIDVTFRHKISSPKFLNPWNKRQGPGVFSLNLTLPKGEILGLVGPNGAGKTTLLRLLAGVIPLDSGTIRLHGDDLNQSREAIDYLLRCNVGHMPEQVRWNGSESVLETVKLFAEMREGDVDSKKLLDLVGLSSKLNDGLDTLSQGMRQRLSLAISLMRDNNWKAMIFQPDSKLISRILDNDHTIDFWQPKAPDIVEMLCSATGLEIEEIGMDINQVTMLPLKIRGEEE